MFAPLLRTGKARHISLAPTFGAARQRTKKRYLFEMFKRIVNPARGVHDVVNVLSRHPNIAAIPN